MKRKYDLIICDLGNVLVNFDHNIAVRKILPYTKKGRNDIYNLFFDSDLTKLYEEGKLSSEEFFHRVKEALDLEIDKDIFFPIWNDIFFQTPLNKEIHNLLKKFKQYYKLIMISNLNESHFLFLKDRLDIFGIFDKLLLSYEVGYRKPAPEIYQKAIDFAKTAPSRAFYIDDRKDLVEAASRLGIRSMVFDGEETLRKIERELTQ